VEFSKKKAKQAVSLKQIVTHAKTGVQNTIYQLDYRLRGNDET